MKNRIVYVLFGFLLASLVAWSSAKHLSPDFRTKEYLNVATITVSATSVTVGTDGVIFATTLQSNAAPSGSAGVLPYPARLDVRTVDGGTATTTALTCTSATIVGTTVGGTPISETVSTITESESLTLNSFESVSTVAFAGCNSVAASADASDVARVGVSDHIALDYPIKSSSDIISVCTRDIDASAQNWTCSNTGCTVKACARSVDLGTCSGLTIADNNALRIRYRASTANLAERCF